MNKRALLGAVLVVLCVARPVRADDQGDWVLEAEAQAGMGLVRATSVHTMHFAQPLVGGMGRGLWQVSPGLSVGPAAGYTWLPNDAGSVDAQGSGTKNHDRLITLLAEARLPLTDGLHLTASLGSMLWRETQIPVGFVNASTRVQSEWSAAGGLALGWNFFNDGRTSMGLAARCLVAAFRGTPTTMLDMGRVAWFSVGLSVGFRP